MTENSNHDTSDDKLDAIIALIVIASITAGALFWLSGMAA